MSDESGHPDDAKTEARLIAVENAILAIQRMAEQSERTHSQLPSLLERAVETAIDRTIASEERMARVWVSAGTQLRRRAREEAGGWVFGFLARGLAWMSVFVVLASVLGWLPALKIMSATKP